MAIVEEVKEVVETTKKKVKAVAVEAEVKAVEVVEAQPEKHPNPILQMAIDQAAERLARANAK